MLVLVAKLGVTPHLGLQRHLASKGAPKGCQGVPNVSKRITKITRAISINDGKCKIDFFEVILRLLEALVSFRASGDNLLRYITRAIVNKNVGKRKIVFVVILRLSEALVGFRASGDNFVALYHQGYSKHK